MSKGTLFDKALGGEVKNGRHCKSIRIKRKVSKRIGLGKYTF